MRKAGVGRVSWRFDRQNVTYLIYFAKIWAIRTSDFNTVVNATKILARTAMGYSAMDPVVNTV